ncbi:hypothetical protein ACFQX8_16305 [Klenkia terrae]|uniref:hypothetical protein n=1 Tax=Klenkia terrae TaxID=1052259 RepID=UPI00361A02C7
MSLRGVLDVVLTDPGVARVVDRAGAADLAVTAPPTVQPLVAAALAAPSPGADVPVLVVTAGERDADATATLLRCFVPDRRVEVFPAWETLPHERLSPGRTPSAAGWPCCATSPTPRPPPAGSTCWSPPSAACCSRWPRAWVTWSRWS